MRKKVGGMVRGRRINAEKTKQRNLLGGNGINMREIPRSNKKKRSRGLGCSENWPKFRQNAQKNRNIL